MQEKIQLDAEKIIDRLKEFTNSQSDKDLCKMLNIHPSLLTKWRAKNSVNLSTIVENIPGIDLNFLLYGTGTIENKQVNEKKINYDIHEIEALQKKILSLENELKKMDESEDYDNRTISDIQKQLKNQNDEINSLRGQLSVLLELIKSNLVPKKS